MVETTAAAKDGPKEKVLVSLPTSDLDWINKEISNGKFLHRSHAIREGLKLLRQRGSPA